ncbi:MAG TPA: hypothetical protein VHI71_08855 [Actinomycetota bacterium]|nr:hypothetical protein [Actinomycetota bacterium]
MERLSTQPRRPNLATIVGSGLAVVAAGSLLAFSSLAEQAGLQGLSTGGLRPAAPSRDGRTPHAITIPAPATAPPRGPREAVDDLVRRVVERDERPALAVPPVVAFVPVDRGPKPKPEPRRLDERARIAVAGPDPSAEEWDGPPYGHAYGYHKKRGERPQPAQDAKKDRPNKDRDEAPVYARSVDDDKAKGSKPPKMKKVATAAPGKAKGHGKHKHPHGNGKAKGHSKNGH